MKQRADGRFVKKITLPNGKAKYFYSTATTEREATKDFNEQIMNYRRAERAGHSFFAVAEKWCKEYRETVSDVNYRKNTRAAYERIIDHFSENTNIRDLTAVEVNAFLASLIARGYYKKTVTNHKCVLNMIFNYAILNGHASTNPLTALRLPQNLPTKPRAMPTTAEIQKVAAHYTGFDLLPYFLLYTGLRISEALALTHADIDLENKLITINKRLIHDNNHPVIENKTKTANSERTVILLDRLAEKLPCKQKGLVFCNEDGTPYTKRQLQIRWSRYQKTHGITLTAHQLRHAYATMLFEAGVDVKDAQELMGHSDINLTRQIYTHIRNERKTETANRLNSFEF